MAGMSLGMSGGDLCPEPARVDTGLLSAFDPYDPGAAALHAAFYSDYRRQLEEALQVNADVNKIRKRLDRVHLLNKSIQEGTHDPSQTNQGTALQEYQVWLKDNEARLAKVRHCKCAALKAPVAPPSCLVHRPPDPAIEPSYLAQAESAEEQDLQQTKASELAEMVACHRELLELLAGVEVVENETVSSDTSLAHCEPDTQGIMLDDDLRTLQDVVSLATDSDSHVSKTDQNKTVRQMMREMTAHSRIPELHSNDPDQEIVVGLSTVKMLPKGEIMNDWDRDVYGVDEFSEEILDDFETSMGALMHEEFSATKASVLKDTNSVQGATGDHPCVESITDELD